jgi:hypothetical protein
MRKADPREVLARARQQAVAIADTKGARALYKVLREAEMDLTYRLAHHEALRGTTGTFGEVQMKVALAQVRDVIDGLRGRLGPVVGASAQEAAEASGEHVVQYMRAAERAFKGVTTPLPLDEAASMDAAIAGTKASVMRRLTVESPSGAGGGILKRYGWETMRWFEQELATGLATRKPTHEVREALVAKSPFLQAAPKYWADRIVRTECLVGETLVSGAVIKAAFRRWYEGAVVEIVTERGRKLTTTPNHPMLSLRSWVASGDLREGDYLVCYVGHQNARASRHEHVAAPPTTVAEIFESIAAIGIRERRRAAQPDFHGDGMNGDVDVSRPDGFLGLGRFAALKKPLVEKLLSPSNHSGFSFCALCERLFPTQEHRCFCWGTDVDARCPQSSVDEFHSNAERFGDGASTFSSSVALNDRGVIDADAGSWVRKHRKAVLRSTRPIAQDSSLTSSEHNSVGAEVEFRRYAGDAQPGDVELDRVREVRFKFFRGHVFNLSTPDGYFLIDGIYTGNTAYAYNKGLHGSMQEAHKQLGDMVRILIGPLDNRTAWDSTLTHGQIRRINEPFIYVGPDGDRKAFLTPPDRPNDRGSVVAHRLSWPIPDSFRPYAMDVVDRKWREERHKGAMPARPLMSTIPLASFAQG